MKELAGHVWSVVVRPRTLPTLLRIPIAYKFALAIFLVITISMSLLGLAIMSEQTGLLRQQIDGFGQTVTNQMAESATDPMLADEITPLDLLADNLMDEVGVLGAAFLSIDGEILSRSGIDPAGAGGPFDGRIDELLTQTTGGIDWYWEASPDEAPDVVTFVKPAMFRDLVTGYAMVTFSRMEMNESLSRSVSTIIAATVVMILLGVLISIWIGRRLTRPIHDLMDASKALSEGDFSYRIEDRRRDEIGDLIAEGVLE